MVGLEKVVLDRGVAKAEVFIVEVVDEGVEEWGLVWRRKVLEWILILVYRLGLHIGRCYVAQDMPFGGTSDNLSLTIPHQKKPQTAIIG